MKTPKVSKNWLKIMGLALSLPSLILFFAWLMKYGVDEKFISKGTGLFLFLAVIFNTFYLMVRYAIKKKN